jgi:hypothetical protein
MTREHDPCAMCDRFIVPADGAPTGHCTAWGEQKPWNGQIGVLFKEAKNRAARQRYVAQQQKQGEAIEA